MCWSAVVVVVLVVLTQRVVLLLVIVLVVVVLAMVVWCWAEYARQTVLITNGPVELRDVIGMYQHTVGCGDHCIRTGMTSASGPPLHPRLARVFASQERAPLGTRSGVHANVWRCMVCG